VKPEEWFRERCLRASSRTGGFAIQESVRKPRQPKRGRVRMIIRVSHFDSLPRECVNALFAAYRADDRRGFDLELIILHFNKTLLICPGPHLIPRDFNFVSDFVKHCTRLSMRAAFDKAHLPRHRLLLDQLEPSVSDR
jgi:hypothetical protein